MKMELAIRYTGFGNRCSNCGRSRETTRYELRQGDKILQEFLICDDCQDKGYVVQFEPDRDPIITTKERQRLVKISRRLELGLAHDVGGKTQPGSGNQDAKCDVRLMDEWRLEHKFTNSSSYSLKVADLATVVRHANLASEWPGLVITYRQQNRRFVVIPYELFLEIVEKMRG
jgi:hypothetical protein